MLIVSDNPLHRQESSAHEWNNDQIRTSRLIIALFEMVATRIDVDQPQSSAFSPGTPTSCAGEVRPLMQGTDKSSLVAMLHDRKQFSSRPNRFCHDPELSVPQSCGKRNLRNQGPNRLPTSACDLRAARPARSPADQARLKARPAYRLGRHAGLKGFDYRHGAVAPVPNCLVKYLCTADPAWMDLRVARCSACISVVPICAGHSEDISLCGRRPAGGARFAGALDGTLPFRDTELEGCDFRGADLRRADLAQARSIKGRCSSEALGNRGMGPLLADTLNQETGLLDPLRVAQPRQPSHSVSADPPIKQLIKTAVEPREQAADHLGLGCRGPGA